MSRRAAQLAHSTMQGGLMPAGARAVASAGRSVPVRGAWLHAIRALSAVPSPDELALDWASRRIEADLPFGLSVVTVPVRGGTESCWEALVKELQDGSVREPEGHGCVQLVSATRSAGDGWLEVGVFALEGREDALRRHLEQAVARANAACS